MQTISMEIAAEVLGPDYTRGMHQSLQKMGNSHLHLSSQDCTLKIASDPTTGNGLF